MCFENQQYVSGLGLAGRLNRVSAEPNYSIILKIKIYGQQTEQFKHKS
jgi:hypothetical protein